MSRRSFDPIDGGLDVGVIALVILVVLIWLAVKALELLVRVISAHPTNMPLWLTLGGCLVLTFYAAHRHGQDPFANVLLALSVVLVFLVGKAVETYHEQRFLRPISSTLVADQVLHEPWWNAA